MEKEYREKLLNWEDSKTIMQLVPTTSQPSTLEKPEKPKASKLKDVYANWSISQKLYRQELEDWKTTKHYYSQLYK
ncbi:hypothetical protein QTJ16_001470 [Diplocarpon rosae]|uniref:Uncharacterized protein n=1 Tax=Diplocarpon rosae TaxID=946125 RepID=A0AAD9T8G5_9HELO|nr:hypothetical protein QTJ16_001470 [Diplocarpon rosae]